MSAPSPRHPPVKRVVLVPAAPISSRGRSDELVRRYRLARLRLEGTARDLPAVPASPLRTAGGRGAASSE